MTTPKKPKRKKVVPLVRAVAKAVVEPPPIIHDEPVGRWYRFQVWLLYLPARIRHAVADSFAQSKDPK